MRKSSWGQLGRCNEFLRLSTYLAYIGKYRPFICSARIYIRTIYLSATCILHRSNFDIHSVASTFSLTSTIMLFFVFLYYLFQSAFIDASPVPSIDNRALTGNRCADLTRCRTIWSIVWSCLATIFSCTWVAVHPNIPCPKKREANSWIERCLWNPLLSFAEHRLPLFVCALLVPEYILAWAIRQFLGARKIAKDNKSEFKTLGHIVTILSN